MTFRLAAGSLAFLTMISATVSVRACQLPARWHVMISEGRSEIQLAMLLPQAPIKVSDPFAIELVICESGGDKIDRVTIDAVMPLHRHGMNYKPIIQDQGNSRYRAQGLLFHMPGRWQIIATVYRGNRPATFKLDVDLQ